MFFNGLEDFFVLFGGYEGDGEIFGIEMFSMIDMVEVGIGISGYVVVDSEVDLFDIDIMVENVGGYVDMFVEFFEFFVFFDMFFLVDIGVDGN